jgi:hypothetical protein
MRFVAVVLALIPLCASATPRTQPRSTRSAAKSGKSRNSTRAVRSTVASAGAVLPAPVLVASVSTSAAPEPAVIDVTASPRLQADLVETHPRRWGMMSGGVALFAAAWVADVGVTYGFHHDPQGVSLIPLIGPLIQCGDKYGYQGPMPMTGNPTVDKQMAQQIGQANSLIQGVTYAGLAIDFVGQLAGLTLAIVGATTHRTEWSRVAVTGRGVAVRF